MAMIGDSYLILSYDGPIEALLKRWDNVGDEAVVKLSRKVCYDPIGQAILGYIELVEVSGSFNLHTSFFSLFIDIPLYS